MRTQEEINAQIEGLEKEKHHFICEGSQRSAELNEYIIRLLKGEESYVELNEYDEEYDEEYDYYGFFTMEWLEGRTEENLFSEVK